jgi:hypothetical protein
MIPAPFAVDTRGTFGASLREYTRRGRVAGKSGVVLDADSWELWD